MQKKYLFISVLLMLSSFFLSCSSSAPIFRLASNGSDYTKIPCSDCQEIQTGRTDCANISSFYVFFDAPSGHTIDSACVKVSWSKEDMLIVGTVEQKDIFPLSKTVCNHKGWGAHIIPSDILHRYTPNASDNQFEVQISVRYVGESKVSDIMKRTIYFID